MAYTHDDLKPRHQSHTGNQPDEYINTSSYMVEVDKFLQGKENHLTHHSRYISGAEFIEKGFPSVEQAKSVMEQ
jgi:hypothetical protein